MVFESLFSHNYKPGMCFRLHGYGNVSIFRTKKRTVCDVLHVVPGSAVLVHVTQGTMAKTVKSSATLLQNLTNSA